MRPFYTEGSSRFITHRCFGCYRVERTSSRAGLSPAVDQRLFTAHSNQWLTSVTVKQDCNLTIKIGQEAWGPTQVVPWVTFRNAVFRSESGFAVDLGCDLRSVPECTSPCRPFKPSGLFSATELSRNCFLRSWQTTSTQTV